MPPPKTGPTTTVVRLPKAQVAAAEAATGLRGGQAVRAVLEAALAPVRVEAGEAGSEGGR